MGLRDLGAAVALLVLLAVLALLAPDFFRLSNIRDLAVRLVSLIDEDHDQTALRAGFSADEMFYASPATGADAVVFNEQGELLLIQRRGDGRWALPGGLAEVGRTLSESALLELWEEAGMRGHGIEFTYGQPIKGL